MKQKISIQVAKCATCKFFNTPKTLKMYGKVVEVESTAPCIKTYNGQKVNYTNVCKNYVKDPYL